MAETRLGRHTWVLVLTIGVALFVADQQTLVATGDPNFVPSVILLGAVVVPAAFVAFVYGRRLPYDVPVGIVVSTAVLGGVIGTIVAGVLEFGTLRDLGVLPLLAVGVIEEAAKLIVPLGVLLLFRYRRPADGIAVGVASGAGFAALETMGYAFVALIRTHGDVSAVANLLVLRGLLSPASHMAWTGITAAALWSAAATGWSSRSVRRFVAIFVTVALLHALWDGLTNLAGYAVIAGVSIGLLAWITHRAAHGENVLDRGDPRRTALSTRQPR
ncbi:MAG TPA: PrsW family intramembrane metalloprotease [Acidimicrobiales bacterium]|jgi:RsiW-degrading membrane proteinase PrsW (M82 family)|nr:PrsW family intramembrane metalloprotease [Acidimicrobiales bacterium]